MPNTWKPHDIDEKGSPIALPATAAMLSVHLLFYPLLDLRQNNFLQMFKLTFQFLPHLGEYLH